jgi:hypothetical protein
LHTGTPVEQEVVPVSHWLAGVQGALGVHATHAPLSQTMLAPHDAPFGPGMPVSAQTDVPVEQDVVPRSHWLVGVHGRPEEHATHDPPLHTMPVPHAVPLDAGVSRSVQVPDEQARLPLSHGLAGVQAVPSVQATHEPLSHTMLAPQAVPFATSSWVG